MAPDPLAAFHAPVRVWFAETFGAPTRAQALAWPAIREGRSTLLLAPTGSGKTLAAFLAAIDALSFAPEPSKRDRCRVLYVSPLKALATDVERNLRAPLAGIARVAARDGTPVRELAIAVRSGDTPAAERARLARTPPDVLITTPESLFLLLTSNARAILAAVDTVIVDEIHAMVGTKRGAHLFLSLERLEALRGTARAPLQRIGLSATQRPLDEVARLLGGGEVEMSPALRPSRARGAKRSARSVEGTPSEHRPRPVTIVDAGEKKAWDLRVEVPAEAFPGKPDPGEPREEGKGTPSVWASIHPRLVELVRAHRSTMIFANSRRLAERLAAAINEEAGEEIALAHHGSLARDRRRVIEERLKAGELPAIVATSSLELGLDLGAVDLVVQIEAPPSVAAGIQRIGRAGHGVGQVSRGVVFPKYRGDLLAAAAAMAGIEAGHVEASFYPKNPLDVLAQQIVAIVAMDPIHVDALYALVRGAAPFADLPLASFEAVLDMVSGRYPSDEFAELKARVTWNRATGMLEAREGARRVAVVSGGTIPDRGLFGVFLVGGPEGASHRVGELDEEMVFESRVGDVFLLGASSWRIEAITHERVLVSPAPGQPAKMPFWHGDRPGRPIELGRAIGALARTIASAPDGDARRLLEEKHRLDPHAAEELVRFVREEARAVGEVPSDRAIVVERFLDELGDFTVCVLSPFGARVHAPWFMAITARLREAGLQVDGLWSDDGMVLRFPAADAPPDAARLVPASAEVEDVVVEALGGSSLFASRFRENAARALLLPRRRPGQRAPLWLQRKRAADLLAVAARHGSFPILLETYRECLRDVFDLPGLVELLRAIERGEVRVAVVDTRTPSPFASSLLFSYVASFIYDGDAPLAERRAQALAVDPVQLRALLGDAELRELLDAEAIAEVERGLQRLSAKRPVASADALHDLLLHLGDLSAHEIAARVASDVAPAKLAEALVAAARAVWLPIAGEPRLVAIEDAARVRDALGVRLPRGVPAALRGEVADPLVDLVSRYARTHAPFTLAALATRFGLAERALAPIVKRLLDAGRLVEGELTPGADGVELCDAEVLRALKRRSLAKLRREIEPVPGDALARFAIEWHGVARPRAGEAALLSAIEQLRGAPLAASALEHDVLPARVAGYRPGDLDALAAAGEVSWVGLEPLGEKDGRIALFLPGDVALLAPPPRPVASDLAKRVRELLASRGALFFADLVAETNAFAPELAAALWELVWAGEATNDTLLPLRTRLASGAAGGSAQAAERRGMLARARRAGARGGLVAPSRRSALPGTEGRWSLVRRGAARSDTERATALARALLDRHGVLTREAAQAEGLAGGFSAVYPILKAMEESGKARRGYFVAGLGATQFALPGADDRLRALRDDLGPDAPVVLAATDPASPYGAALAWPERDGAEAPAERPQRAAGAHVILHHGACVAFLGRTARSLLTFARPDADARREADRAIADALAALASARRRVLVVETIDAAPAVASPLAAALLGAGFVATGSVLVLRPLAEA